ncbi:chromate efflux transporter [Longispora sp. NPDC051575]|uniref:chromate efflux transporter n=1 Tax=Longispora sp. NPDC051575 TaxID=3154943 RepID=UPI00341ABDCA
MTEVGAVPLRVIAGQWLRLGCLGFGGPPAHIALLRQLCVRRRGWISDREFEDGIAATNLLPGPASTQLAIYCGWRLRGVAGGLLAGVCFIAPGLVVILGLAAFLLSGHPAAPVLGAAAGAGAAVPAVAVHAAAGLVPASWKRAGPHRPALARWAAYVLAGGTAAAITGPWLVLVLLACGAIETVTRLGPPRHRPAALPLAVGLGAGSGLVALCWTALKVGALSYGGGFVIIPLMRADAVDTHHWMTGQEFLYAVALGQITPGPVVQTVAVVGYAAAGVGGGLLAALVAFAPSFVFVLAGARHFDRLRANPRIRTFLTGAGAATIGAIAGSAIPLAWTLTEWWQFAVTVAAAVWLLVFRRGVVTALVSAAVLGALAVVVGL